VSYGCAFLSWGDRFHVAQPIVSLRAKAFPKQAILRRRPTFMYKPFLIVATLCTFLASCTQEDNAKAKQKLENAKDELHQDLHKAGQEMKKDSHEAATELRKDAHEAKKEIKKDSDELSEKAKQH
jgi:hypothetical protein